jgi:hypothetical protein
MPTSNQLTDAEIPVSSHLTYGPMPDWTTEIAYSVRYRYCEVTDPMYGQNAIQEAGVGPDGWTAAQHTVEVLSRPIRVSLESEERRVIHDMIEIYAQTVMRSPQKLIVGSV